MAEKKEGRDEDKERAIRMQVIEEIPNLERRNSMKEETMAGSTEETSQRHEKDVLGLGWWMERDTNGHWCIWTAKDGKVWPRGYAPEEVVDCYQAALAHKSRADEERVRADINFQQFEEAARMASEYGEKLEEVEAKLAEVEGGNYLRPVVYKRPQAPEPAPDEWPQLPAELIVGETDTFRNIIFYVNALLAHARHTQQRVEALEARTAGDR